MQKIWMLCFCAFGAAVMLANPGFAQDTSVEEANQEEVVAAPEAAPSVNSADPVERRVAALIEIVKQEPAAHERAKPWEVPVAELELEMQSKPNAEVEARLAAWQVMLQEQAQIRNRLDILLNNPDKLENVRAKRMADAKAKRSSGSATPDEEITLDQVKESLAERSQAQQSVVRAIVERTEAIIAIAKRRGIDTKEQERFVATVTGQKINFWDPAILLAQIRAWGMSNDGGIKWLTNIGKFFAILVAFWILAKLVAGITGAAIGRMPKASSLLKPLLVSIVRRTVFFVGLIVAVSALGVNIGPLLAMIGAAGLVIGLALQGTLSNFASGILILLNRPYDVGDVINAGGVLGSVKAMNLVSTTILTFDNQKMMVPNNEIWSGVITNITALPTRRVDLVFGIAYDGDMDQAVDIIKNVTGIHDKVLDDPATVIKVHELADNSVNIICRPWCKASDYWDVHWDITKRVKERLDEAGIGIPFPQRDLHVPGAIEVKMIGETSNV